MKIAFLIIDMQTVHIQGRIEEKAVANACEYINYVSDLLRSKDHVVVHIQDVEGMEESNKEKFGFIPEVQIREQDLKVTKEYSNAFWKTELESLLRSHDVELVVISGLEAQHCVLFTYNGARERGFKTVILQNGILSSNPESVVSTSRERNLISYPAIEYLVNR
ncbi:cysteine hydrolase family protein [Cohnella caldifontis]|uniref:cysteine hydrolase family protein n=1 Tax=Cohnella caldifontis TaxID=3027471 RepID=UPI0023ECB952|nr:isochorismatase family protein [Cohnella sp. YIM B05605]